MLNIIDFLDINLLLFINHNNSSFLDRIMWFASEKLTWLPFYIMLLFIIIYNFKWNSLIIIIVLFFVILVSDQIASGIIKPIVHRLRPSHEPGLENLLYYVNDYRGGLYGFMSSHSCNSFSVSFFLTFIFKKKFLWLKIILFIWSFLIAYSRIYLGVHYPSDVIAPIFVSFMIAYIFKSAYFIVSNKLSFSDYFNKLKSNNYNKKK